MSEEAALYETEQLKQWYQIHWQSSSPYRHVKHHRHRLYEVDACGVDLSRMPSPGTASPKLVAEGPNNGGVEAETLLFQGGDETI